MLARAREAALSCSAITLKDEDRRLAHTTLFGAPPARAVDRGGISGGKACDNEWKLLVCRRGGVGRFGSNEAENGDEGLVVVVGSFAEIGHPISVAAEDPKDGSLGLADRRGRDGSDGMCEVEVI